MIDTEKYLPNSLRKGRADAFQKDIQFAYEKYFNIMDAQLMSLDCFTNIWTQTKMKFIFQCRGEEEDEEEYAQLLYQIIFKQYFLNKGKKSMVFSLFALYSLYYSCERRRKILISKFYVDELAQFLKNNKQDKQAYYLKVSLHLFKNCFAFATKVGLRNPMIQPSGEVIKKSVVLKTDLSGYMREMSLQLKQIQDSFGEYTQAKEEFEKEDGRTLKELKIGNTDKYFIKRLQNLTQAFDKQMQHLEGQKKEEQEEE